MKKFLCKFANSILRKYTNPILNFNEDIYINGQTFKFISATSEGYASERVRINFEVMQGN